MSVMEEGMPALAVRYWSAGGPPIRPRHDLLIAAVETPDTPVRHQARRLARTALAEMLGIHLGCPPAAVRLVSAPGQPLRLDQGSGGIGLSVSHEPKLSLVAIHLAGPVGIDVMLVSREPAWLSEIPALARDYLGPEVANRLAQLPARERAFRFAQAWTGLEARLKCLGMGLEEWSPSLDGQLAGCRSYSLHLPAGYVGSVAVNGRTATDEDESGV